jgi:hypothetical protein
MKLIIAGSRSITSYETLRTALTMSGLWAEHKRKIEVVSGKAKGVDTLGEVFAEKAGLKVHAKPAKWDNIRAAGAVVKTRRDGVKYNALAGHWRNEEMAQMADACLVVWDGKSTGSLDMLHRMIALEKPTYLYPLKIGIDLFDQLSNTDCVILLPEGLTVGS